MERSPRKLTAGFDRFAGDYRRKEEKKKEKKKKRKGGKKSCNFTLFALPAEEICFNKDIPDISRGKAGELRSIFRIDSTSPNGPFFINERKGCEVSVPREKAVEKFRICMAMQFARSPEAQKLSAEVKSERKKKKEEKANDERDRKKTTRERFARQLYIFVRPPKHRELS